MSDRYAPVGDFIRSTISSQVSSDPAEPWMDDGLCHDERYDPNMWHAAPSEGRKVSLAKEICRACPVQTACLNYAIRKRDGWGIFGGLTAAERTRMYKPSKGSLLKCRYCGDEFRAPTGNYRYCEQHRSNADRAAVAKRPAA